MKDDPNPLTIMPATTIMTVGPTVRGSNASEPYLIIVSGNERGKHHKLKPRRNILGRDCSADIVIADPKVSRCHGALHVDSNGILLEDTGSSNGTYVDGVRIDRHKLDSRQRIRIGDTHMRIDYKSIGEAEADQALFQAANTDDLTALLNRGTFMRRAEEEVAFCKRNGGRLSVVICDADHFKLKNDCYGHQAGDAILQQLASILSQEVRKEDLLARYGGEEFIMLLRESSPISTIIWAERVRCRVMVHPFLYQGCSIPTTISIGICSLEAHAIESLHAMIQMADSALYRAKRDGRNRVESTDAC